MNGRSFHVTHAARLGFAVIAGALMLGAKGPASAPRDDEILAQLRQQIRQLEKVPGEAPGGFEKQRNEKRLATLRQEVAVLEKRRLLEEQERERREASATTPRTQIREKLQAVAPDGVVVENRIRDLNARRVTATAEREALTRKLSEARHVTTPGAAVDAADAEEKIITKDEELRAIALRAEAAENEADLVRLAQSLRDRLKTLEAAGARPTLRGMLATQTQEHDDDKIAGQLGARMSGIDATLGNYESNLELQREKLTGYDEEIRLFEGKVTPAQRRPPATEQMLAADRLQQRTLTERLPFLTDQVEALRQSRAMLGAEQELLSLAGQVRSDDFAAMKAAYLARLRTPGIIIAVLLGIYLVLSRLVFPYRCRKEELILTRRVGRYVVMFLSVVVIAIDSIEDVRLLATTLGVASAGVVIALQDVAMALFGWCTIILGRKFTVGDRLEIDGVRGDVLDIQLMRTTLVELNNWLGVDQPTGRVFIVPNTFVFKSKVFNYSHGHPYIWGVVDVTVTFATPAASALSLFQKVLDEETREAFDEARVAAQEMERRYGVEDADYHPKVYTRIADSGVTFSLLYVCHYRQSPVMRNRLNRRLISELETHPHIRLAYPTRHLVNSEETSAPSAVLGFDSTNAPFLRPPARVLPAVETD